MQQDNRIPQLMLFENMLMVAAEQFQPEVALSALTTVAIMIYRSRANSRNNNLKSFMDGIKVTWNAQLLKDDLHKEAAQYTKDIRNAN